MIQIAVLGYGTVGSGAISREIRSRKKSYMILMLF